MCLIFVGGQDENVCCTEQLSSMIFRGGPDNGDPLTVLPLKKPPTKARNKPFGAVGLFSVVI